MNQEIIADITIIDPIYDQYKNIMKEDMFIKELPYYIIKYDGKARTRAPNRFIVYRSKGYNWLQKNGFIGIKEQGQSGIHMRTLSKIITEFWKDLPQHHKDYYKVKGDFIFKEYKKLLAQNPIKGQKYQITFNDTRGSQLLQLFNNPNTTYQNIQDEIITEKELRYSEQLIQENRSVVLYEYAEKQLTSYNNYWDLRLSQILRLKNEKFGIVQKMEIIPEDQLCIDYYNQ